MLLLHATFFVSGAAFLAQAAGALLSLRMFRSYGRHPVWLLISLVSLGVAWRSGRLFRQAGSLDLAAECSALALSLALALGLSIVDSIFRQRLKSEETLQGEKRRLSMLVDRRVADLETEVAERKRAENALRLDGERFSAIIATQYDIATAERDLPAIMELIVARTQSLTGASGAILQLVEANVVERHEASMIEHISRQYDGVTDLTVLDRSQYIFSYH